MVVAETGGTPGGPVGAGLRQPPVEGPAQQLPYPTVSIFVPSVFLLYLSAS